MTASAPSPSRSTGSPSFESIPYEEYRKTGGNSFVEVQDGLTNYELSGDASRAHTAIMIHGGTIPLCIWEPQMAALLGAGFRVLRYDQYGRGFSDRPKTVYSQDLFLRQLKGLLDALQIFTPVTLVGPSFGGAIAVNFAAHHPERVRSIILVSPALNLINSESPLSGTIKLLRTPVIGELLYRLFIRSKIIARGRALVPGGKGSPCDTTFLNQFTCRGTQHGLFSMFRSDAYGDYRELTRKTGKLIPHILLIRGKQDTEITRKMIDEIRDDLPTAEFVEIENSGHGACSDAAEEFNRMAIEFIGKH
ncbi:MAG: alpha/beta hydrolase [Chitinispirillaceae bacterium]|nr:alpha/beta hydrolase [Chitinispirillaceae bacterium]